MSLGHSHRTLHLTLTATLASSVGWGGLCPGGVRKPPPPSRVAREPNKERRMASPANIAKHPLHPILVLLPIGLWIFSLLSDLVYAFEV
jgi:hypothetical protein